MSFLLDTNVVSEGMRPHPDIAVMAWLANVDEDRVFISVVTLAELHRGIEQLAAGTRRARLDIWLTEQLPARFETRVLSVDADIAHDWGRLVARRQAIGRPISAMDALIAATAEQHDLTLVTRNTSDFEGLNLQLINPWRAVSP